MGRLFRLTIGFYTPMRRYVAPEVAQAPPDLIGAQTRAATNHASQSHYMWDAN
jgi:hypothetical protein